MGLSMFTAYQTVVRPRVTSPVVSVVTRLKCCVYSQPDSQRVGRYRVLPFVSSLINPCGDPVVFISRGRMPPAAEFVQADRHCQRQAVLAHSITTQIGLGTFTRLWLYASSPVV